MSLKTANPIPSNQSTMKAQIINHSRGSTMTKLRKLTIFPLCLDLLGTLLLFFSFQITSTDFVITKTDDGKTAFCVGRSALFVADPNGGMGFGTRCPNFEAGIPIAAIYTAHPSFVTWGFVCILLGFAAQLLGALKPSKILSRPERRRKSREERKKQKSGD